MPFVGNHNSEEAPSIEDAFEPDNEGSHSNSNDPGNGIASKTQFPDTSELNTEIARYYLSRHISPDLMALI